MDRLACVDIPALPLQLLLQAQPDWVHLPVAVVEADRPQAAVLFLNERARQAGVRSGQRYATALALAGDLRAAVVSRSQIDESVRLLADCLRRYSPHVEPSTETPGVFWLDAKGLNRLYPSLQAWVQAVRLALQRAGVRATIAVGVSRFGAYALARSYRGSVICVDAAEERAAVQRVPLARLDLDPDVRERLLTLGIDTVGAFLRLPADGIRQRFGEHADALYQRAAGRRWAPLVPVPAEKRYERELHFDAPESNTERLVFVIKRLLDSLLSDLTRHAQAVVGIALSFILDDRSTRLEQVRPASPTIDVAQLVALVRLRLDALGLSAGIVTLRVRMETCGAAPHQRQLLLQTRRDADAANQALARLRAEIGEDRVVRARLCEAHLPAARFAWEPLAHVTIHASPRVVAVRSLVRRIYTQPLPIGVSGSGLQTLGFGPKSGSQSPKPRAIVGPYIISGGWWGGGIRRDYYFTETDDENLRWVYYDHRKARVFLQGMVE